MASRYISISFDKESLPNRTVLRDAIEAYEEAYRGEKSARFQLSIDNAFRRIQADLASDLLREKQKLKAQQADLDGAGREVEKLREENAKLKAQLAEEKKVSSVLGDDVRHQLANKGLNREAVAQVMKDMIDLLK